MDFLRNQEDSLMLNLSAVERGMFHSTYYKMYKEELKSNENFKKPSKDETSKYKHHLDYSKLDSRGFPKINTKLVKDDIIIGKVRKLDNREQYANYLYKDLSIPMKDNEGTVDAIEEDKTSDGNRFVKIRLRIDRQPRVGDKFVSRCAQKGICGIVYREEDMPFTADGIRPALIINPHCIPSRMTIGQIIECVQSKACAWFGRFADATPFTDLSVEDVIKDLESTGQDKHGYEEMYNPFTGEKIKAKIFIGPTYYQRLKHMVDDKMHCLTPEHEVLTTKGWKRFSDLSEKDLVASLCDDQLVFEHPLNILHFPEYDGDIYTLRNKNGVNLEVTNEHRMYVKRTQGSISEFELLETKDLEVDQVYYKTDALLCDTDMNHLINAWPNGAWSAVRDPNTKRWHLTNDNVRDNEVKVNHYTEMSIRNYAGPVWCLQIPSEIFLVRSTIPGSIPVWTGNSRARGPYQMQTRQPVEGRRSAGGLRFGTMEADCIISHGTAKFLKERFNECSDGFDCYVCDKTGLIAFGNPNKRYFYGKGADNYCSITKLKIPYAFKQFLYECMTIGISPRLITDQSTI